MVKLVAEALSSSEATRPHAEFRSDTGKLLARLSADGLEIKCARSKRVQVLTWDDLHHLEAELRR